MLNDLLKTKFQGNMPRQTRNIKFQGNMPGPRKNQKFQDNAQYNKLE